MGGTTASSGGSGAATGSTSMTGGNGGVGGQAGGGPPLNGLVAYYPLDGDAQDASGNGYHGVVNNMSCAEPAVVGQGCYTGINGGNAQVNPYPLSPSEPAGFSGAIWAKLDGLDGERLLWDLGYESFAAKYFGIGEGVHCIMRSGEDIFYNQNEQGMPPDNFVPTPGAWHHIACVFDRQQGDMRLYIDGALLESYGVPFVAFPSESNDGMGIGCRGSGYCAVPYTEIHNAVTIDELRLYNRPLSAAEVKALM